jgi:uridylate kinase
VPTDAPAAGQARVMLKLSGELLAGAGGEPLGAEGLAATTALIAEARDAGAQVAVVMGGGNILRGGRLSATALPRTDADAIGMAATLVNALAVQAALAARQVPARVFSAFEVPRLAALVDARRARETLAAGGVALFAGGTGNPYFTTDTAAVLRALEIGCTLLVKGTKVDGVYAADPIAHPRAERFAQLTYDEMLARKLAVMDLTAVTLCMENGLPLVVLDARAPGVMRRLLSGERVGTRISAR